MVTLRKATTLAESAIHTAVTMCALGVGLIVLVVFHAVCAPFQAWLRSDVATPVHSRVTTPTDLKAAEIA